MASSDTLQFAQPALMQGLASLDDAGLDLLDFGVIGFSKAPEATVVRYSAHEVRLSGLDRSRVLGLPLFAVVAQCMNNFMVAHRFDEAVEHSSPLDHTLDYTFTLRMKPTPVVLRLLSSPDHPIQYIAVQRPA